ncbi:hypothetical protein DFH06DRAFT_1053126 [Mycena polygramma]|nr:hypothetical protein DFH06DRAFT_1053126 [Mycena polygramma]
MGPDIVRSGELFVAGTPHMKCTLIRGTADTFLKDKKHNEAHLEYIKAAVAMLGRNLPTDGPFHFPQYERLKPNWEMTDTMACLNGAAESLWHLRQYKQALWFAGEVDVVVRNVQIATSRASPVFDWLSFNVKMPEFYVERLRSYVLRDRIFRALGNTAAANERRLVATMLVPQDLVTPQMREIHPIIRDDPVFKLRHPDPALVASLELTDPSLQVLGSWRKVPLKKVGGITSRSNFASFVFEGHLYILGGEKGARGPFHRDFWRIDLAALDEWQPLPAYPVPTSVTGHLCGYSMTVHDDCAYLFTGRRDLDVFDLRTQTWATMHTSLAEPWPYAGDKVIDYALQSARGSLYVFGGAHAGSPIGCTLLMGLDLASRTWTRLSGAATAEKASYAGPGPRTHTCSWVGAGAGGEADTIFVMYGEADRHAAQRAKMPYGTDKSHAHEDLWGWDIAARQWTRHRVLGNAPSPRMEMACVYNPVLDHVITFGGYAPSIPSLAGPVQSPFFFSYYADTFILASSPAAAPAPAWQHVLARGFPTYRAQAHLAVDPATGRTFLFGGHVDAAYIPSRSADATTQRVFGDLWELRLDVPGGGFAAVDVEDEARTARVGPWQRCFACGSVGPWKKCGGACGGQAFFCDASCLKEGWKEHKVKHKCRK